MRKFYFLALILILGQTSFANKIIASQNGIWQATNTWNLGRKPVNGDTIYVPAGRTVTVNAGTSLQNVYVHVAGNLKLSNLFSYLDLGNSSKIVVATGGKIETTLDYVQYVILAGQTIFWAGEIIGPVQAAPGTNGFGLFNPLPVQFVGFMLTKKENNVMIQWATAREINASMYEVERSFDGRSWDVIAYVSAIGNSEALNSYAYTDKNLKAAAIYYRIRQVDNDGKYTYTDIKVIRQAVEENSGVRIASSQHKVLLHFPKELKGQFSVRFVNTAGQVVDQQMITNPVGQVVLNSKVNGSCIISLSNGNNFHVARQVIL